jgi:predicted peptidase
MTWISRTLPGALLVFLQLGTAMTSSAQSGAPSTVVFERTVSSAVEGRYLIHLPDGYDDSEQRWPLILFLHGSGERGNEIERVSIHGPLKRIREGFDLPFVIVAPQVPEGERWTPERLDAVMADVLERYRIDDERMYLTGLSMGGYGTWDFAMSRPDVFAAIAPICGGGQAHFACVLRDTPVWAFHGARDTVVPAERSREIVRVLEGCDGNIHYTEYPDAGHDSWTETYANPALYDWFLQHRRSAGK